jgi:hypothetical protein
VGVHVHSPASAAGPLCTHLRPSRCWLCPQLGLGISVGGSIWKTLLPVPSCYTRTSTCLHSLTGLRSGIRDWFLIVGKFWRGTQIAVVPLITLMRPDTCHATLSGRGRGRMGRPGPALALVVSRKQH